MSTIFPNQQDAADKVIKAFEENEELAVMMVIGVTQGGKTGAMLATSNNFTSHPTMQVPEENIFFITGFSSVDWEIQTKERLPEALKSNVFHRNKLITQFKSKIQNKKNVLLLIDEVQIASGATNTLAVVFKMLGYFDVNYLVENNIRIVMFSATPNGTIYDGIDLEKHFAITKLNPSNGYHGAEYYKSKDRLRKCRPLTGDNFDEEAVHELKATIEENYPTPKYHIIRTPTGLGQFEVIINFFGKLDETNKRADGIFDSNEYDYQLYDMENLSKSYKNKHTGEFEAEIDLLLQKTPSKHTFIFLKEKARCSKTFPKKNIGIWYERATAKTMDDVIIQGLLGRACGYDDPGNSIIYTNLQSVDDYLDLWNSDFDTHCHWASSTTKKPVSHDEVQSRGTWVSLIKSE